MAKLSLMAVQRCFFFELVSGCDLTEPSFHDSMDERRSSERYGCELVVPGEVLAEVVSVEVDGGDPVREGILILEIVTVGCLDVMG